MNIEKFNSIVCLYQFETINEDFRKNHQNLITLLATQVSSLVFAIHFTTIGDESHHPLTQTSASRLWNTSINKSLVKLP